MMVGGTETTSVTLSVYTYHLLSNPHMQRTLQAELSTIVSNTKALPRWQTLRKLPYFTAVILESLRLVYGVSGRLPRIAVDEDLAYKGSWRPPNALHPHEVSYVVPRGYSIGMSAYVMHTDESIFPDAMEFNPDRWLLPTGELNRDLERYLLSFSKGSRQCAGMQ